MVKKKTEAKATDNNDDDKESSMAWRSAKNRERNNEFSFQSRKWRYFKLESVEDSYKEEPPAIIRCWCAVFLNVPGKRLYRERSLSNAERG